MRNNYAAVSDPNEFVTDPGSEIHELFSARIMSDGTIQLVSSGKENIQDKIDSYRSMTDMAYILSRMALGDTSVLTDKVPMFGDFTGAPSNYAEALQLVMDAERQFLRLPMEIRNAFDNDYRKWFASAGSDDWMSKMDPVIPKPDVTIDPIKDEQVSE